MAKKKEKPAVHVQNMNLEIDYDKLAEAIVRAQEESKKRSKEGKYTTGVLSAPLSIFFKAFSVMGWLLVVLAPFSLYQVCRRLSWETGTAIAVNIVGILLIGLIMVALALFSCILWKAAKEVEEEKDRYYLVSLFSGMVSFVALIVAIVALYK